MKTGIESLDTGASKITYEGDEGPRSPQQKENEMFQMAMKSGLIDEYRNYKMEMENAGQPVLSIREYFKIMYDASRIGVKEGGRVAFRGGGMDASQDDFGVSKSSSDKTTDKTTDAPAGGASAGGNYGGNVNPDQTYGGGDVNPGLETDVDRFKLAKENQEKQEEENILKKFLSNATYSTRKNLYNLTPNSPINELGFISMLTQEQIEDLDDDEITEAYNKLSSIGDTDETFADVAEDVGKFSFDSFEKLRDPNLTTGDDMSFAEYAAKYKGAPGMLFSGDVGGLQTIKNPDGTYSYEKIRGEGGAGGNLPLIATGNTPGDNDPGDSDPGDSTIPTNRLPLVDLTNFFGSNPDMSGQYFYGADGGRPGYMGGGIADLRQGYFLGKLVKKATRGIKKIFKSPLGKAALIGGLGYLGGGGGLSNFFGKGSFNPLKALITTGPQTGKIGSSGLGNILAKFGLANEGSLTGKGMLALGGATLSSLPLLFSGDDDDKRDYRAEYDAEVQKYLDMYGPANFRRYAADGGRMGFAVGGYDDDDDDDKDVRSSALNQLYGINRLRRSLGGSTGLPPITQAVDGISTQSFSDDETPEPMQTTPDQMPRPRMMSPMMNRQMNPMMMRMQPRMMAQEGGLMDMDGMEKDYRNEGGFVAIGGKERADDVPARLSKNEFVFTADAVRNAGGGDIDKGAEIMENMMGHLEQGGEVSKESQGLKGARQMFATSQRLEEVL